MKPMTALAILLCFACQALIVVGQLFLKHGIRAEEPGTPHAQATPRSRKAASFALGIACLSVWFFLWLGLLSRWDISKLYPFEGLNPVLMAVSAWLFLKEKLPASAWIGLCLVCLGIAVVSTT